MWAEEVHGTLLAHGRRSCIQMAFNIISMKASPVIFKGATPQPSSQVSPCVDHMCVAIVRKRQ